MLDCPICMRIFYFAQNHLWLVFLSQTNHVPHALRHLMRSYILLIKQEYDLAVAMNYSRNRLLVKNGIAPEGSWA